MTRPTLTAAVKRQITADWLQSFPSLSVRKPMWLMKRNGPLVMGIRLDRTTSNSEYIPVFHVHNLLVPWPVVSLTLDHALPDPKEPRLQRGIRVDRHADECADAVELMKKLVPDLTQKNAKLSRILGLYQEYLESRRQPGISRYPVTLFADVILLSFWSGCREYANQCLDDASTAMSGWPSDKVDLAVWRQSMAEQLNEEYLQTVLDEQISRHKLQAVTTYELERDAPLEPSLAKVYGRLRPR